MPHRHLYDDVVTGASWTASPAKLVCAQRAIQARYGLPRDRRDSPALAVAAFYPASPSIPPIASDEEEE